METLRGFGTILTDVWQNEQDMVRLLALSLLLTGVGAYLHFRDDHFWGGLAVAGGLASFIYAAGWPQTPMMYLYVVFAVPLIAPAAVIAWERISSHERRPRHIENRTDEAVPAITLQDYRTIDLGLVSSH